MPKKPFIFILITLLIFAALFWWLKPAEMSTDTSSPVQTESLTPAPVIPQVIAFELEDGKLSRGPEVLQVQQHETLRLQFTSDQNAELHLHGYDLTLQLLAGQPAELTFKAEHSGRFEYELHGKSHHHHGALGVIEVLPQ